MKNLLISFDRIILMINYLQIRIPELILSIPGKNERDPV